MQLFQKLSSFNRWE